MYDLIIKNATVITVDPLHSLYQPGYIAVKGERIAAIGPMEEFPDGVSAPKVIDADGMCVLPGLVDAHGHAGHCMIKTMGEACESAGDDAWWLEMAEDVYFHYTDEFFWYAEGALAAAERLKFGVTTGVSMLGSIPRPDRVENLQAHFEGAVKTGIRQVSGIGACDGPWPKRPWVWDGDSYTEHTLTPEQMVEVTERSVRELNGKHKRQICIVAPGCIGYNPVEETKEFAVWKDKEMYRIARTYGVPVHTHLYSGGVKFVYETTPELLNPHTSLTHCTGISEDEVKILAETGAVVLHGPATRANVKSRCPVYELLRAGVEVAIVTDGTAPDRSFDIWRDMKMFQVIHRIHEHDTLLAPAGKVLEMCTIVPARALGLDHEIGSLEVGKKADMIIVNTKQPHLAPFGIMPVQRLVYHAQGNDVDTVIVDGEVMMEGRIMKACDEARVLKDAELAFEQMRGRLGKKFDAFCSYGDIFGLRGETVPGPYKK